MELALPRQSQPQQAHHYHRLRLRLLAPPGTKQFCCLTTPSPYNRPRKRCKKTSSTATVCTAPETCIRKHTNGVRKHPTQLLEGSECSSVFLFFPFSPGKGVWGFTLQLQLRLPCTRDRKQQHAANSLTTSPHDRQSALNDFLGQPVHLMLRGFSTPTDQSHHKAASKPTPA